MSGSRLRATALAVSVVAFGLASTSASGDNGYVNRPQRGCSPPFHEDSATRVPGFAASDINGDGIVCVKQIPGRPGFDGVVDNTSNAGGNAD
jgi:hypothetical protein